jgi:hypothetical protein
MTVARLSGRWTIGMIVGAGLLVLVGANAHLLYVALMSQPDCVAHVRPGEAAAGGQSFSAAKSACSGGRR